MANQSGTLVFLGEKKKGGGGAFNENGSQMWVFLSDSVDKEETCFRKRKRIQSSEKTGTFKMK